jgi:hypothetical protein
MPAICNQGTAYDPLLTNK